VQWYTKYNVLWDRRCSPLEHADETEVQQSGRIPPPASTLRRLGRLPLAGVNENPGVRSCGVCGGWLIAQEGLTWLCLQPGDRAILGRVGGEKGGRMERGWRAGGLLKSLPGRPP